MRPVSVMKRARKGTLRKSAPARASAALGRGASMRRDAGENWLVSAGTNGFRSCGWRGLRVCSYSTYIEWRNWLVSAGTKGFRSCGWREFWNQRRGQRLH
jgi:hypothetical protein